MVKTVNTYDDYITLVLLLLFFLKKKKKLQ